MRSIDTYFYKTTRWKNTRKLYALSKHCICERCGKPVYLSGINDYLPKDKRIKGIVHHKIHLNESNYTDEAIAYGFDNLELLDIECHNQIHMSTDTTRQDVMFDEEGNLIKR